MNLDYSFLWPGTPVHQGYQFIVPYSHLVRIQFSSFRVVMNHEYAQTQPPALAVSRRQLPFAGTTQPITWSAIWQPICLIEQVLRELYANLTEESCATVELHQPRARKQVYTYRTA